MGRTNSLMTPKSSATTTRVMTRSRSLSPVIVIPLNSQAATANAHALVTIRISHVFMGASFHGASGAASCWSVASSRVPVAGGVEQRRLGGGQVPGQLVDGRL